ncbi:MOSC domain-containing protein [Bremerella sp. JC770]|uniref:MOSC domain-containing protein n=1 Tax=Bremerella sp. JC770 TaxID=3232137 RepID=UPI0034576B3A
MNFPPGQVVAVCLSSGGIPRLPVESAQLTIVGFENDGHRYEEHYNPKRAVTLLSQAILDHHERDGHKFPPGSAGENITVNRLDLSNYEPGTRLRVGSAEIQLEKPWKPCHFKDAATGRSQPNDAGCSGWFASVVREGTIQPGDPVEVVSL